MKVLGDVGEMGEEPAVLAESPLLSDGTVRIWHFDIELSSRIRRVHLVVADDEPNSGIAWRDINVTVAPPRPLSFTHEITFKPSLMQ